MVQTTDNVLTKERIKTAEENEIHTNVQLGNQDLFIMDCNSNESFVLLAYGSYDIVFSGVIYNKQSIKERLEKVGVTFYTASDSEVLGALYEYKKERLLEDLRGKFSFIIWDKQENILFGARDHFGIKPLYYMTHENGMYFASEIRAFQKYIHPTKINSEALHHYFSFQYVPQPMTMYHDIYALEAGSYFYKEVVSS